MGLMGNLFGGGKKGGDKRKSDRRSATGRGRRAAPGRGDSTKRAVPRKPSGRSSSVVKKPRPSSTATTGHKPAGGAVLTKGGGVQRKTGDSSVRRRRTSMKSKQIGQLLLKAEAITEEQLEKAIAVQQEKGGLLGQILVELEFCDKKDIGAVIKKQRTITTVVLPEVNFEQAAVNLLDREFCEKNRLIAFEKIGNHLCIAMANVLDTQAKNDIKESTQLQPKTFDAPWQDIETAIGKHFGAAPAAAPEEAAPAASVDEDIVIELPEDEAASSALIEGTSELPSMQNAGPVSSGAVEMGQSERKPAVKPEPAPAQEKPAPKAAQPVPHDEDTVDAPIPTPQPVEEAEPIELAETADVYDLADMEDVVEVAPPSSMDADTEDDIIDIADVDEIEEIAPQPEPGEEAEEAIPEAADLGIAEVDDEPAVTELDVQPIEEVAPAGPPLPSTVMQAIPVSMGYFSEVVQWGAADAERRWLAEHLADNVLPAMTAPDAKVS